MAKLYLLYLLIFVLMRTIPTIWAISCYSCAESYTNGKEELSFSSPTGCTLSNARGREIAKEYCGSGDDNYCFTLKANDQVLKGVFIVNRFCGSKDMCDRAKKWETMNHKDIVYCQRCETDFCNDKKEGNGVITGTGGGSNDGHYFNKSTNLCSNSINLLVLIIAIAEIMLFL